MKSSMTESFFGGALQAASNVAPPAQHDEEGDKGHDEQVVVEEEAKEEGGSSASSSSASSSASSKAFQITLGEYEKHGEGMKAYVTYKVNVKTSLAQYHQKQFTVERRYSDFFWLHDRLGENFKGVIIPPLPEKTIIQNRFDTFFIERRRRELQQFLREVVQHPILCTSECLQTFLEANGESLEEAKTKKPQAGYTKKVFSFLSSAVTMSAPQEVDQWFEEKKNYLADLSDSLATMLQSSQTLSAKRRGTLLWFLHYLNLWLAIYFYNDLELANLIYDFSMAAKAVSDVEDKYSIASSAASSVDKQEKEEGEEEPESKGDAPSERVEFSIASPLKALDNKLGLHWSKLGDASEGVRLVLQEAVGDQEVYFEEVIAHHTRVLEAAKTTLNNRLTSLAELQHLEKQLAGKRDRLDKVKGTNKATAVENEITELEKRIESNKDEFEMISDSVKNEIVRFEKTKATQITRALREYAKCSMDSTVQMADEWKKLLNQLQSL
ncbi:PX domain-containing protein [Balamuthia mandrillaris]